MWTGCNSPLSPPQHAGHVTITENTVSMVDLRWFSTFFFPPEHLQTFRSNYRHFLGGNSHLIFGTDWANAANDFVDCQRSPRKPPCEDFSLGCSPRQALHIIALSVQTTTICLMHSITPGTLFTLFFLQHVLLLPTVRLLLLSWINVCLSVTDKRPEIQPLFRNHIKVRFCLTDQVPRMSVLNCWFVHWAWREVQRGACSLWACPRPLELASVSSCWNANCDEVQESQLKLRYEGMVAVVYSIFIYINDHSTLSFIYRRSLWCVATQPPILIPCVFFFVCFFLPICRSSKTCSSEDMPSTWTLNVPPASQH